MEGIPSGLLNHWLAVPVISVALATFLFKAITSAKRRGRPPTDVTPAPSPSPSPSPPPLPDSNPSPLQPPQVDHGEIQPAIETESGDNENNKTKEEEQNALPTAQEKADAEESLVKPAPEEIGAEDGKDDDEYHPAISGEERVENSGEIDSPIGKLSRPPVPDSLKKSGSFLTKLISLGRSARPAEDGGGGGGDKRVDEQEDEGTRQHVNNRAESFIQQVKKGFQQERLLSMVRSRQLRDQDPDKAKAD